MDWTKFEQFMLQGTNSISTGADGREFLMARAAEEYGKKNYTNSIYYQVKAVYESVQERLSQNDTELINGQDNGQWLDALQNHFTQLEMVDFRTNPLLKAADRELRAMAKNNFVIGEPAESINFLQNVESVQHGVQVISDICQQLPKEWTVLQLSKGINASSTHEIFPSIFIEPAAIYVTVLRHARSAEFPQPICCRIHKPKEQAEVFRTQGTISDGFRACITVNHEEYTSQDARAQYWSKLADYNEQIINSLDAMKKLLYPWGFLFFGQPHSTLDLTNYRKVAFAEVDKFCTKIKCSKNAAHIFLSLAALHVTHLVDKDILSICSLLFEKQEEEKEEAYKLLFKLKLIAPQMKELLGNGNMLPNFPCILIVDERLDHFFWEEVCTQQEFSRVSSLQWLVHLYNAYKDRIENGYFQVDLKMGACLLNPGQNLPKSELMMKNFLEYYLPNWKILASKIPTEEDLFDDLMTYDCYLYAGHGSGLQYVNGNKIAQQRIKCVTFLFGCDSSRLLSQGLHSELVGPHLYYQAAFCPTLVGALMPALDRSIEDLAAEILSRWVIPVSSDKIHWTDVNSRHWYREGNIKKAKTTDKKYTDSLVNVGSLCAVMALVHQRLNGKFLYQTVQFICRGLPAFNTNFPMSFN